MGMRKASGAIAASVAIAATTTVTLGLGTVVAPPAGAQSGPYAEDVVGNFFGDSRDELLAYVAGPSPDLLVEFTRYGGPGAEIDFTTSGLTVNGNYDPVAGDFDGDGYDEILWYAAGTQVDYLWNFSADGSGYTTKPYTASGLYWPVAGDLSGDGVDDILWYAPGPAQDYVWDYNGGGAGYTSAARTINGYYQPLVGSFGSNNTDDILWYTPGPSMDYLWDYNPNGSYTTKAYPANGYYYPFVLDIFNDGWRGDDIFWYAPGTPADFVWDYQNGVKSQFVETVNGDYYTDPGDFFGDGHDDVLWLGDAGLKVWDYTPDGGGGVVRYDYDFTMGTMSASRSAAPSAPAEGTTGGAGPFATPGSATAVPGPAHP
jgi:hypothetical protein